MRDTVVSAVLFVVCLLVVRPYSEGDEFAINDAFNRIFGCRRTIEEWVWKFSVEGAREATVAAWDGDDLAAHNGGIPVNFEVGGRRVRGVLLTGQHRISNNFPSTGMSLSIAVYPRLLY